MSVADLRKEARVLGVDLSKCVEKSEMVALITEARVKAISQPKSSPTPTTDPSVASMSVSDLRKEAKLLVVDLSNISELRKEAKQLGIDISQCVEKREMGSLIMAERGKQGIRTAAPAAAPAAPDPAPSPPPAAAPPAAAAAPAADAAGETPLKVGDSVVLRRKAGPEATQKCLKRGETGMITKISFLGIVVEADGVKDVFSRSDICLPGEEGPEEEPTEPEVRLVGTPPADSEVPKREESPEETQEEKKFRQLTRKNTAEVLSKTLIFRNEMRKGTPSRSPAPADRPGADEGRKRKRCQFPDNVVSNITQYEAVYTHGRVGLEDPGPCPAYPRESAEARKKRRLDSAAAGRTVSRGSSPPAEGWTDEPVPAYLLEMARQQQKDYEREGRASAGGGGDDAPAAGGGEGGGG